MQTVPLQTRSCHHHVGAASLAVCPGAPVAVRPLLSPSSPLARCVMRQRYTLLSTSAILCRQAQSPSLQPGRLPGRHQRDLPPVGIHMVWACAVVSLCVQSEVRLPEQQYMYTMKMERKNGATGWSEKSSNWHESGGQFSGAVAA